MKHTNLREMFGSVKKKSRGKRRERSNEKLTSETHFVGVLAEFHIQSDLSW